MSIEEQNLTDAQSLRKKAEEQLKIKQKKTATPDMGTDVTRLLHELQVHQIELEMQNEELAIAKEKAELSEEKYTELYDFAPSGYLSLTKDGIISELNFATARMLGKERSLLKNSTFSLYINLETRPAFNKYFDEIFKSKVKVTCEDVIATEGNLPIYVNLDGIVSKNDELCLLSLVDISILLNKNY